MCVCAYQLCERVCMCMCEFVARCAPKPKLFEHNSDPTPSPLVYNIIAVLCVVCEANYCCTNLLVCRGIMMCVLCLASVCMCLCVHWGAQTVLIGAHANGKRLAVSFAFDCSTTSSVRHESCRVASTRTAAPAPTRAK